MYRSKLKTLAGIVVCNHMNEKYDKKQQTTNQTNTCPSDETIKARSNITEGVVRKGRQNRHCSIDVGVGYYYLLGLLLTVYGNILGRFIDGEAKSSHYEIDQLNIFP